MIPIKNVYYMLSYAFQVLQEQNYRKLATEEFHNTAELCAAILSRGIATQIKRGLVHGYIDKTESLSSLRGKLDISDSIKTQAVIKKQMVCSFDEFSVNTEMNQIIKSTVQILLRAAINKGRKKELRSLLLYFSEVDVVDLRSVNWNRHYDRNNATYQMLVAICYLVYKGLLQSKEDGSTKLMEFIDEQRMCRLYEKFILEYYRKEFPKINASASQIKWQLDDGIGNMLPVMQSDIMLASKDNSKVLIIDAKYYTKTTQAQFGTHTLHSHNLYQIFTYVKNKEYELKDGPHEVAGMLLYAKTNEAVVPDNKYSMSGNSITVRTLDLNCEFSEIAKQLNEIAVSYFGVA